MTILESDDALTRFATYFPFWQGDQRAEILVAKAKQKTFQALLAAAVSVSLDAIDLMILEWKDLPEGMRVAYAEYLRELEEYEQPDGWIYAEVPVNSEDFEHLKTQRRALDEVLAEGQKFDLVRELS